MKGQRRVREISIITGSGNVYAEIGDPDHKTMPVKAQLAAKIGEIFRRRALRQAEAAEIPGLTQSKSSGCSKASFAGFPITACWNASLAWGGTPSRSET